MKVAKPHGPIVPKYPTRRQFVLQARHLGLAALGVTTLMTGTCQTPHRTGGVPARGDFEGTRLGGVAPRSVQADAPTLPLG